MLVLKRSPQESIVIVVPPSTAKTTIRIKVVNNVITKLAVDAPRWVDVDREEVALAKQRGITPGEAQLILDAQDAKLTRRHRQKM